MSNIPRPERHCGSWVISRKSDGVGVLELFDRRVVESVNTEKYVIETAATYLPKENP